LRKDDKKSVYLATDHDSYDVEELEIVHESCDVCNGNLPFDEKNYCENCGAKLEEKQEPLGDFEDDWSMKDETE
jgi:predicted amidophosphoribosyltransferase